MWLACKIVAQGMREGTHAQSKEGTHDKAHPQSKNDKASLLSGGPSWKGWLGSPDGGEAAGREEGEG